MTTTAIRESHTPITPAPVEIGSLICGVPQASTDRSRLAIAPVTFAQLGQRRPHAPHRSWRSVVAAACIRVWDAALGPPLTDQARMQRKIAEFNAIKHPGLTLGF